MFWEEGGYRGSVSSFPWKILCFPWLFPCLLAFHHFSLSFACFLVFRSFSKQLSGFRNFQKKFSAFRRYFQVFWFSVTQKYHFPGSSTLLFPVFCRFFFLFPVFHHFFGAFLVFCHKYNTPSGNHILCGSNRGFQHPV